MAPAVQPLFVSEALVEGSGPLPRWTRVEFQAMRLPLTLTDTLQLYNVTHGLPWVLMLDEQSFRALPAALRLELLMVQRAAGRGGVQHVADWRGRVSRADAEVIARQAGTDLFLWWPGLWWALSGAGRETVLLDFLTEDRLLHRGAELTKKDWQRVDTRLPGVRTLAGRYAAESGANCLSTVLAAFGHPGVADLWLHQGPFERWLQGAKPDADPSAPGTVLVWRDATGCLQHAAVSLGGGWVFQKDAQAWYAPRQIVALPDLLARWHQSNWTVTAFCR